MRWSVLLLLVATGCPSPLANLRSSRQLAAGGATFDLRYSDPDASEPDRLAASLTRAAPKLSRWGGLEKPVTLNLVPGHDELERAVHRSGWGWLRAWAQYDAVILQSPKTWLPATGHDDELDALLAHELTHCVLFQRSATPDTWLKRDIPLWFREGMATNTADQGKRFMSLEDLARWLEANPTLDVFKDGEALSQEFYEAVYGLSHHAMAFLLRRYGDAAVISTMSVMSKGTAFPDAFNQGTGLKLASFQREFLNFVRYRGFRGAGLPVRKRDWRERMDLLRPR